jgi:hypothetical protein
MGTAFVGSGGGHVLWKRLSWDWYPFINSCRGRSSCWLSDWKLVLGWVSRACVRGFTHLILFLSLEGAPRVISSSRWDPRLITVLEKGGQEWWDSCGSKISVWVNVGISFGLVLSLGGRLEVISGSRWISEWKLVLGFLWRGPGVTSGSRWLSE